MEPIYKLDCGNNIYGASGVNILHLDEVLLLMPASPTMVGLSTEQRAPLAVWGRYVLGWATLWTSHIIAWMHNNSGSDAPSLLDQHYCV